MAALPRISFGYTWPAFVARQKTVTRRDWKPRTAKRFEAGLVFEAMNKQAMYGGVPIGKARMTVDAYQQPLDQMPVEDFEAEGFRWLREHLHLVPKSCQDQIWYPCTMQAFLAWKAARSTLWVVRFEVLEICPAADALLQRILERPSN